MRCDQLLVGRANRRDLHERHSSLDRDIVHHFDKDVTFPRSSVSAAAKWEIRRLITQSRIRRYRSNHRVGTCSQMDTNRGTLIRHHLDRDRHQPTHPDRHHIQTYLIQLQPTLQIPSTSWLCGFGIMTLRD